MSRVFSNQKYTNGDTYTCRTLKSFLWAKYHMSMKQFRKMSSVVQESYKNEFRRDYRIVYGEEAKV